MTLDRDTREEIVRRICAVASPTRVILFGSHARGDAAGDSDVDLLVVVEETPSPRELAVKIHKALGGLGKPFDVIVATVDMMARFGDIPGVIYEEAASEGVELYAG
ncbi:MAG TPA: nucleotidyltransferase domain-containing protein [bacterium]|nr:nucleotidyltransferase domain-containing protein [bacterium]